MLTNNILFKAKSIREPDGDWVEGFFWSDNEGNYYIKRIYKENDCSLSEDVKINPETLGMCSFIQDKNHKFMWEHDIVKSTLLYANRPVYGIVKFKDGAFGLEWPRGKAKEFMPFTSICNVLYQIEGNYFDNRELRKEVTA